MPHFSTVGALVYFLPGIFLTLWPLDFWTTIFYFWTLGHLSIIFPHLKNAACLCQAPTRRPQLPWNGCHTTNSVAPGVPFCIYTASTALFCCICPFVHMRSLYCSCGKALERRSCFVMHLLALWILSYGLGHAGNCVYFFVCGMVTVLFKQIPTPLCTAAYMSGSGFSFVCLAKAHI